MNLHFWPNLGRWPKPQWRQPGGRIQRLELHLSLPYLQSMATKIKGGFGGSTALPGVGGLEPPCPHAGFAPCLDVLEIVKKDSCKPTSNGGSFGLIGKIESFDFVFIMHLMIELLSTTDSLSKVL